MWFIGVILFAGTSISLLVLGSATYLEHDAAARAQAREMAALAVPLPTPRPKPPEVPRVQPVNAAPVEIVREPKQTWAKNGRGWQSNHGHWNRWQSNKGRWNKSAWKQKGKPRPTRWVQETW